MTSRSLKTPSRVLGLLAVGLFSHGFAPPAVGADPGITSQPVSGLAANGEPFGFSVAAAGTAPLQYQWFRNGASLLSQTNDVLFFVSVTNSDAGTYQVIVTNTVGSVTSSPVNLTVTSGLARTITTGKVRLLTAAEVPILLSANGREHVLSYSLGFDTNFFANPTYMPAVSSGTTFDTSRASEGLVSGSLTLLPGEVFPPGRSVALYLYFDLISGTNPLLGGLYFTNLSLTATNVAFTTNDLPLAANTVVSPQFEALTLAPALNRQSGLFEHVLQIGYAGAGTLENVDMLMGGLGIDSRTNLIRVHNAVGLKTIGPDAQGFFQSVPFFSVGPLAGGQTRNVTAEYYVTDKVTVPSPEYQLQIGPRTGFTVPASATPLNITTNRFVNGTFIIQWASRPDYNYFVQYAPTMDDLMNNSTNARIVNPAVAGTGYSVQWIDNGPPKTESPPTVGSRFFRVLEFPVD